jgi:tetratricopeptide (TPR) repeat protein
LRNYPVKFFSIRYLYTILLLMSVAVFALKARAQSISSAADAANALFQEQKWAEAAKGYEAITKAEPSNGRAWYRLGASRLALGSYEQAAAAFKQAIDVSSRPEPMYGLALAYAKLNDKERAFEWLNKSLKANLSQPNQILTDPNLDTLRNDHRFKEVLAAVDKLSHPCMNQPEYKGLDFWVGEWVVTSNGQRVANSSIQRIVDGCIIFENYSQMDGFAGKSFNFFDANLHRWRQTWVDGTGRTSEFSGEYRDGAMRFEGESHLQDGTRVLRHMTIFNLDPTHVRQLSEASTDDGKTWRVTYDFIYTRGR